ncbi:MAG: hypothetical protein ACJ731_12820 [Vicinamibacterales bacterium]
MKIQAIRRAAAGGASAFLVLAWVADAQAQDPTGRVTVEAVASASVSSADDGDPFLMFDQTSTVGVGRGWDVVVRPWARRMPGGDWAAEMYQLQVRYTSSTHIPVRLDAGIICSPIGLSTLELRPDVNPTIGAPFYYFVPLPAFDGNFDRVTLMSGGYPLGAIVSASGSHWDVRGGVTDATPTRARSVFSGSKGPAAIQLVVGGGITPIAGLRFGGAVAAGRYRIDTLSQRTVLIPEGSYGAEYATNGIVAKGALLPDASADVYSLEGEYAVGYTRISGELIVDRFETMISPAVSHGLNLLAVQTLSPRWFAAGRIVRASTPVLMGATAGRRVAKSGEATLGYRLNRTITFRAAYQGSTSFSRPAWQHAIAFSTVWSQRWW